jgi:drug/metabolite transporter (DMT)-like permease
MLAILGGLGAALIFATATLCSSRSTRMIGPSSVLGWVMTVGLLLIGPTAAIEGVPADLDAGSLGWLTATGFSNVIGLLLAYAGLRNGKVGIVAPIVSTQGAIAAVIAVGAGERIAPGAGATLGVIALGIILAAIPRDDDTAPATRHSRRATLYALAAALAFGISLYATGHLSARLPLPWVLLPARLVGALVVALPLAVTARLRLTRRALPLVVASGICEVAGFGLFALGAQHGIAVTAVLASQFAALAALIAYLLFRERLTPAQVVGVAAIVVGVGTLSALQA